MLTLPRHSSCILTFLAIAIATPAVVVADARPEAPSGDPDRHLAKARDALARGSWSRAERAYGKALAVDGDCGECQLGLLRAAAGRGRWGDAALWAGAVVESAAAADGEAVLEEVEALFRRGLGATGGEDPDVLWGLITVLGQRGRATEIALLADRHLATPEERALICAADPRASLDGGEAPAIGAELNDKLRDVGWPGPFLAAGAVRRPRTRVPVFREASKGFRMMGVVDVRGLVGEVRLVRPPPVKPGPMLWDEIRRTLFDPATWRGRRIAACLPFTVKVPELAPPGGGGGGTVVAGGFSTEPSPLFATVEGMASAREILALVRQAGPGVTPGQRAAICAARSGFDELNDGLRELPWWQSGPFLDSDAIDDPRPRESPAPEYTEAARAAGVEGEVVVSAVIDAAGRVSHAEALEGLAEGLTEKALEALARWSFQPATWNGESVSVCRRLRLTFELETGAPVEGGG